MPSKLSFPNPYLISLKHRGKVCYLLIFGRFSLHIPGWPRIHYVDQVGLELTEIREPLQPSVGIKGVRQGKVYFDSVLELSVHLKRESMMEFIQENMHLGTLKARLQTEAKNTGQLHDQAQGSKDCPTTLPSPA